MTKLRLTERHICIYIFFIGCKLPIYKIFSEFTNFYDVQYKLAHSIGAVGQ